MPLCQPHHPAPRAAATWNLSRRPPASGTKPLETRDWASLPKDILLGVFLKLGPCEIMQSAELVCKPWRHVAVEEPSLWRRIDMGTDSTPSAVSMDPVHRSMGQCEAFSGSCDGDLLLYVVERTPSLKSLHLSSFDGPDEMLNVALKKLPHLEDLEISPSNANTRRSLFRSICETCPRLKTLTVKFSNVPFTCDRYYDIEFFRVTVKGEISMMPELRSLKLFDCYLSAMGLSAILDYCPILESLHITGSFTDKMDAELRVKCSKVKKLTLPDDCIEGYDPTEDYDREDEFYRMHYDHHESRDYEIWELPFHPQYHFLCDDLDFTDYGFPFEWNNQSL